MQDYPKKSTPADHKIHDLIKDRWSPLAISSEPIEEEKINSLFEALRWAPSSFNGQPWRLIYATQANPEKFDKIASLLFDGNDWAKKAYMLIIFCSVKDFEYNGKPNRHAEYDTGSASENLFLQANAMGLVAHEMAGYDHEKSYEVLGIPEGVTSLSMMAVGYPGDPAELDEGLTKRENGPRERKALSEITFEGEWKA